MLGKKWHFAVCGCQLIPKGFVLIKMLNTLNSFNTGFSGYVLSEKYRQGQK